MEWTQSQNQLIKIANEPVKHTCEVDIVEIHEFGSGVTTVLKHINRTCSEGRNRNLWVDAPRPWDACISLVKLANAGHGCGYLDILWKTMKALSGDEHRPLVLWMDECRLMKPVDREMLIVHMEYCAIHLGLSIRIVFLLGRVMKWNLASRERESVFTHSDRIHKRARLFEFRKQKLQEAELPRTRAIA